MRTDIASSATAHKHTKISVYHTHTSTEHPVTLFMSQKYSFSQNNTTKESTIPLSLCRFLTNQCLSDKMAHETVSLCFSPGGQLLVE